MFGLSPLVLKLIGGALIIAGLVAGAFYVKHRIYMSGYDDAVAVYETAAAKRALQDATRINDATREMARVALPIHIKLDRLKAAPAALDEQLKEAVDEAPEYAGAVRPDAFLRLRKARLDQVRRAAERPQL
jgi:hypothetical protein